MSVNYNCVSFDRPTTTHTMKPIKDPSGTDQLYTEITLEVKSRINPQLVPGLAGETDPGTIIARIRHLLTSPRKPLYYDLTSLPGATGPNPIINLPQGYDDANGPWPAVLSADYTTIQTIEVSWKVTVRLRDCLPGNGFAYAEGGNWLSLRYDERLAWDSTWKATRTYSGTLIRSSLDPLSIEAYRLASTMTPAILPGFQRVAASYTLARTNLSCDFQFVDEQIRYAPPPQIVEMTIVQEENGASLVANREGRVQVSLVGRLDATPKYLADWGMKICKARVDAASPLLTKDGKAPGQFLIRTDESTKDVRVAVSFSYKRVPTDQLNIPSFTWLGQLGRRIRGRLDEWNANAEEAARRAMPAGVPEMNWIGAGTQNRNLVEIKGGYAAWADPEGIVGGPIVGVGWAAMLGELKLYSSILRDPCGQLGFGMCGPTTPPATTDTGDGGTIFQTPVPLFQTGDDGTGNFPGAGTGSGGTGILSVNVLGAEINAVEQPNNLALWYYDGSAGSYDFWQSNNVYSRDPGTLVIPTADSSGKNIQVKHSSEMMTLTKQWAASKVGGYPTLPPEELADPNWIFVGSSPQIREFALAVDGLSKRYEVRGEYVYQALDASKVSRTADIPPFLNASAFGQQVDWFDQQLTAQANSSASGGNFGSPLPQLGSASSSSPLGNGALLWTVPN